MRVLIYKRTHTGDPDPEHGIFGEANCMGKVRGRGFDAVIGVGGISHEPRVKGIARKLTWVGIGARKWGDSSEPLIRFADHFWCLDKAGPYLMNIAPNLARYVFEINRRWYIHVLPENLPDAESDDDVKPMDRDIIKILTLARKTGPSPASGEVVTQQVAGRPRKIGQNGCNSQSLSPSISNESACRDLRSRQRSC